MERCLITESCPYCKHPVYADEGYYSTSGAHANCYDKLPKERKSFAAQKKETLSAVAQAELAQKIAGQAGVYEWSVTAPKTGHSGTGWDAGQRGWRLHLVEGGKTGWVMGGKYKAPSLCGLVPSHGWGFDLFIDTPCKRCHAIAENLGIEMPGIVTA